MGGGLLGQRVTCALREQLRRFHQTTATGYRESWRCAHKGCFDIPGAPAALAQLIDREARPISTDTGLLMGTGRGGRRRATRAPTCAMSEHRRQAVTAASTNDQPYGRRRHPGPRLLLRMQQPLDRGRVGDEAAADGASDERAEIVPDGTGRTVPPWPHLACSRVEPASTRTYVRPRSTSNGPFVVALTGSDLSSRWKPATRLLGDYRRRAHNQVEHSVLEALPLRPMI